MLGVVHSGVWAFSVGPGHFVHSGVLALSVTPGHFVPYSGVWAFSVGPGPVSYTHLRAHETYQDLVCRLLLEKKKFF